MQKLRVHPAKGEAIPAPFNEQGLRGPPTRPASAPAYAELQVASNFSFLRGASHPDELAAHAAAMGCSAVAITDINSLAGVVRAHVAAKESGIRLVVGSWIVLGEEERDNGTKGQRHKGAEA